MNQKRNLSPLSAEISSATNRDFRELSSALRYMDKILRREKAIFIISNLTENSQINDLKVCLRSWAYDDQIVRKDSLIIIISSDLQCLFGKDDNTKNALIIHPVELGREKEREIVIEYCATEAFKTKLSAEDKSSLLTLTSGLNLHQIESMLRESWYFQHKFDLERIKSAKSEFIKNTDVLEIFYPRYGFEAVGGYKEVKDFVQENIISVLKEEKKELARELDVSLPRGILLFGPPRTGKTLFSKALAKELCLPFLNLKTQNLYSKWLGESGRNLEKAIRIIEEMGLVIVFIDEIDRLGRRRGNISDGAGEETRRVLSQLLEWLGDKERKAIIVGTTNLPSDLDEALLGVGRLDYKIPFLYPDKEARKEILKIHLGFEGNVRGKLKLSFNIDAFLEEISFRIELFNGGELEEIANRVRRYAFKKGKKCVEKEYFDEVLSQFRINREDRLRNLEKCLKEAEEYTDDATFLNKIQTYWQPKLTQEFSLESNRLI